MRKKRQSPETQLLGKLSTQGHHTIKQNVYLKYIQISVERGRWSNSTATGMASSRRWELDGRFAQPLAPLVMVTTKLFILLSRQLKEYRSRQKNQKGTFIK